MGEEYGWTGRGGLHEETEFGSLIAGSYILTAVTAEGLVGEAGPVDLTASEGHEIEIAVSPGGTIRIHYEGEHPHLQCGVLRNGGQLAAGTATSGGDEVFTVAPGKATVRMVVYDRTQQATPAVRAFEELREVEVVAGEETRIDIRL